jgi:hypothetical protein
MTYIAHGITLALAWFIVANAIVSAAIATVVSRLSDRRWRRLSARLLFGLRIAPAVVSVAFVAAVFVPSYLVFEPREAVEGFDVTLTFGAIAAGTMLTYALAQGAVAWRRTAARTGEWLRGATPLSGAPDAVPMFAIHAPAPLMALAGLVRPRVFVSERLLTALTPQEFVATVAHELSHWRARDNVKRLAMRAAPDWLRGTSVARRIERQWAVAAEHRADDCGAGRDASTRCTLASALVKVARLAPSAPAALEPISTLVGGGELASRIERLLDESSTPAAARRSRRSVAVGVAGIAALAIAYAPLLRAIHEATEILVNTLP